MTESEETHKRKFNWRGLASLVVTLTFFVIVITGLLLYVAPQGRVANWIDWRLLGLSKDQWAAIHTTMSILFIFASGFHIYFNWRTIVGYIVRKRTFNLKLETAISVILVIAVFLGTYYEAPPFSNIIGLNESIKEYWDAQSSQAPYPHAETSTVADFALQTGASLETLLERFAAAGIRVDDPASQTIGELAEGAGLAPYELFAIISPSGVPSVYTTGLGMQSLTVFCTSNNLDLQKVISVLQNDGYTVEPSSTIKSLAGQKGMTPTELKDSILEKVK